MARFYPGQPVVCVRDLDYWLSGIIAAPRGIVVPRLGQRYVVAGYSCPLYATYLNLVGLGTGTNCNYNEDGFEPITERQVRTIIEEALRTSRRERA